MKTALQSTPYFAAYPLKAIQSATETGAVHQLTNTGKTKSITRIRVFPMANPYPSVLPATTPVRQQATDQYSGGGDWFINYE